MKINERKIHLFVFLIIFLGSFLCLQNIVLAEEVSYELLAPIPIEDTSGVDSQTTASDYVVGIVRLAIAVAAVLAVVRIIFAGIKYMSTEAFQGKGEAKTDIQNAIWGLALAIGAYLILNTINPRLVEFKLKIPGLVVGGEFGADLGSTQRNKLDPSQLFFAGCHDCNMIDTRVPHKPLGTGCALTNPLNSAPVAACLVSNAVNDRLYEVTQKLSRFGVTTDEWWVTEMFPPTVSHKSSCHKAGMTGGSCVDIALKNTSSLMDIMWFLSAIRESGLKFIYEVPNDARRRELIANPQIRFSSDNIKVTGNKEHAHVGFWGENAVTDDTPPEGDDY